VHCAFGELKGDNTWAETVQETFTVETEEDRLNVGPMELDNGGVAFGISRRAPRRMERQY